jgi:hypothetical protein
MRHEFYVCKQCGRYRAPADLDSRDICHICRGDKNKYTKKQQKGKKQKGKRKR